MLIYVIYLSGFHSCITYKSTRYFNLWLTYMYVRQVLPAFHCSDPNVYSYIYMILFYNSDLSLCINAFDSVSWFCGLIQATFICINALISLFGSNQFHVYLCMLLPHSSDPMAHPYMYIWLVHGLIVQYDWFSLHDLEPYIHGLLFHDSCWSYCLFVPFMNLI